MSVSRIGPNDFDRLSRFFEENNVPPTTRFFAPFPLTGGSARKIARRKNKDRYFVGKIGERVVAMCMLRGWDKGYAVPSLGVLVDYRCRRRGFGRVMTEFALLDAERLGCKAVRLSVHAGNRIARRLYY